MKKTNKLIALSLAATIMVAPIAVSAKEITVPEGAQVEDLMSEVKGEYIEFHGKIKSLNLENGKGSILVQGEDEELVFHINDDVLIQDMTKTKENKIMHLKEDAEIVAFYGIHTPVTMSLPGQLTPEVIVVKNGDMQVKVDKFDENLVSSDNKVKLNIQENEDDYKNKTLLVYWTVATHSIPSQVGPQLVVVLESNEAEKPVERKETKITNLNKIIVDDKEVSLPLIEEDNVTLIPVRELAEALDYKVTWNGHNKPIEISKGAQWTSIELNKNSYTFARMAAFELEQAPTLKNSKTYVPVSFIEKVLQAETSINNGVLTIK